MISFLLEAMLISVSGVMSPGPVTAVAVGRGSESPHAGALVALGHGIVEFPLIAAVAWGLGRWVQAGPAKLGIALVGGIVLVIVGIGMLRNTRAEQRSAERGHRYPLVAGILLSAGNPFFLVWWVTVGGTLIARGLEYGAWGVAALAIAHWSIDLGWCSLLSALSHRGGQVFGKRFRQVVLSACGVFMLAFGGKYIVEAVRGIVA
ncbi:MAG: LysE family transporter [Anaerolineae bacterium]|nr:LysE family transporter [Anaerolineae bacterium]